MGNSYRALDLFCGAGGAAMGLKRAGFDVVGVDIERQPEFPFDFIRSDVFDLDIGSLGHFDLIWASPPCQAYSIVVNFQVNPATGKRNKKVYPDLVGPTHELLRSTKIPYVIENVPRAPIRKDLMLCGVMFGLRVLRHRHFEIEGFWAWQPDHPPHKGYVKNGDYITVVSWGSCTDGTHNYTFLKGMEGKSKLETRQFAMGIDWITDLKMLAEAVPPAYAEYIGQQAILTLGAKQ